MTDERSAALVRAVEELNVLPLVDESLDRRDPRWLLQVAAAVSGAAEAQAMVRASTLEARDYHDAPRLIDNVAFRASGMQGDDPHTTSVMWSLWTLSRLQARVALLDASEGSPLSKAATTASRALYAMWSAMAVRQVGEEDYRTECLKVARECLADATLLLHEDVDYSQ